MYMQLSDKRDVLDGEEQLLQNTHILLLRHQIEIKCLLFCGSLTTNLDVLPTFVFAGAIQATQII